MKYSVIIPFTQPSEYLYECLEYLQKQTYRNFEIILLPDKMEFFKYPKVKVIETGRKGPAEKRDIGSKKARGEILAFIDDDAYPDKNWLKNALPYFGEKNITAVCGPGITPIDDDVFRQAGGYINSLAFGSGGAGTYRFIPQKKRYVDDFPSMNFLVRKSGFLDVGGFETYFWPGEDTKLCFDLVYKLRKKIIYDPSILVYHHRKPLFLPHLSQISRFALHRGHFARILPRTSLRIGYLIPTLFDIFLISGVILAPFNYWWRIIWISILVLYLMVLVINIIYIVYRAKSALIGFLTGIGIVLTHVIYGLLFPVGFFKKTLKR